MSSPVIDVDGSIYIGSVDDNVYKLDPVTGAQVWNFTATGGIGKASPALWNDLIVFGCDDDNVYAVNKVTGAKVWSRITQVRPLRLRRESHSQCNDGSFTRRPVSGGVSPLPQACGP